MPADREGEARQLVTELAPGAQLTYSVGGTLKYELPTEQVGGKGGDSPGWNPDPPTHKKPLGMLAAVYWS